VISVIIESLAYGGDGVARLPGGRTVFVQGACPGDEVALAEIEEHQNWSRATIDRVIVPSPDRITPPCPYAGACGGCQWQHIAYERQLDAKHRIVADAFERIARLDGVVVDEVRASQSPLGYRNKIELVWDVSSGRAGLGYHRPRSEEIVAIDRCMLLPERAQGLPRSLTGALRYLSGRFGDLGILRVGVRAAAKRGDLEIALWTRPASFPRAAVGATLTDAAGATSVVRVLARDTEARRRIAGVEVLTGRGNWVETLSGFDYAISAPSFFQVNTASANFLVELVMSGLNPAATDRVADMYAGAGTFTLPLAQAAGEVVAFEGSRHALADLRRNLDRAGLPADIVGGDAARELLTAGAFDLAVVDPPRQGLSPEALRAVVSANPRAIAYVSCDPATLARDSRELVNRNYRITRVTPVDMFPQTYHVETVVIFRQNGERLP